MIKNLTSGTPAFTRPSGPIKCAGTPQKIAYLAADYWRGQGVLEDIRGLMVLPTPGMFGVKVFSDELDRVVADYGIEVRFKQRNGRSGSFLPDRGHCGQQRRDQEIAAL